mmetsp:Transcript_4675/g.15141  ORF Transcript_4675/g.15141 Transcript_4675/m.15141 type:complete len:340 (+) Transcript_4675:918-1937(+)
MLSMSTLSCSSPRPLTSYDSPSVVTEMDTLFCVSRSSRSPIMADVSRVPSWPWNGDELTPNTMDSVGGSSGGLNSGATTSGDATVCVTDASESPASCTMSPAPASSSATVSVPRRAMILVMRPVSTTLPSRLSACTGMFTRAVPAAMRPVSTRPRKLSYDSMLARKANGAPSSTRGGGTLALSWSSSGVMSRRSSASRSFTAQPSRAEAYRMGKSSCSSLASSDTNRSNTSFTTSSTRDVSRSTLLITTTGRRPRCRAFMVTYLVCVLGPSVAHTSSATPSTMFITRSTSPPKSACPGVSTMLRRTPPCSTDVTFDMMVIPRSCSSDMLSMTRSVPTSP